MILLHFAYPQEANEFIKHFKLKPNSELRDLYSNENLSAIIAGEGLYDSMYKLGFIFSKLNISKVINIGIAGALSSNIQKDKIYKVKTAYAFDELTPKFQSFTSGDKSEVDCISAQKRALEIEYVNSIKPFAHICDRELWSVAKTCKYFKVPFSSYKYISDIAGVDSNCLDIKDKADFYSFKLLEFYLEQETSVKIKSDLDLVPPYQMGHYLFKKYQKIISKLLKSNYSSETEILKMIDLKLIDSSFNKQKDRAIELIQKLEFMLNPIDNKIQNKIDVLFRPFIENGISIETDKNLEKQYFKISKQINSKKNLDDLSKAIKNFSYDELERFWQGNLDV